MVSNSGRVGQFPPYILTHDSAAKTFPFKTLNNNFDQTDPFTEVEDLIRSLKNHFPALLDNFLQLPDIQQFIIVQVIKVLKDKDISQVISDLFYLYTYSQGQEELNEWILQTVNTWKVHSLAALIDLIKSEHKQDVFSFMKVCDALDEAKNPYQLFSSIQPLILYHSQKTEWQIIGNAILYIAHEKQIPTLEVISSDKIALKILIHIPAERILKAILYSPLHLVFKLDLIKSKLIRMHMFQAFVDDQGKYQNSYNSLILKVTKNGMTTTLSFSYFNSVELLFEHSQLAQKVYAISNAVQDQEEILLKLLKFKDFNCIEKIFEFLISKPSEYIKKVLVLIHYIYKDRKYSIRSCLDILETYHCPLRIIDQLNSFAIHYPHHLAIPLNLFLITCKEKKKLEHLEIQTREKIKSLHQVQQTSNSIKSKKNISLRRNLKIELEDLKKESAHLKSLWILQKTSSGEFLYEMILNDDPHRTQNLRIYFLDFLSCVLGMDKQDIQTNIPTLIKMWEEEEGSFASLVECTRNLSFLNLTLWLNYSLKLYAYQKSLFDDVVSFGIQDSVGLDVILRINGFSKLSLDLPSIIKWIKWLKVHLDISDDFSYFLSGESNKINRISDFIFDVMQRNENAFCWIIHNSKYHSLVTLKFLNYLILKSPIYPEYLQKNPTKLINFLKFRINDVSSFIYQKLIILKKPSKKFISQLMFLLTINEEIFVRKLLRLYEVNPKLAKKLLELSVEGFQKKLSRKILDYTQAHPSSLLTERVLYYLELDAVEIIQNLFRLGSLIKNSKKDSIYHRFLKNLKNTPIHHFQLDCLTKGHHYEYHRLTHIQNKTDLSNKDLALLHASQEHNLIHFRLLDQLPDSLWDHCPPISPELIISFGEILKLFGQEILTKSFELIKFTNPTIPLTIMAGMVFVHEENAIYSALNPLEIHQKAIKKLEELRKNFQDRLNNINATLHPKKNADLAYSTILPKVITSILLKKESKINIHLIYLIKTIFIDPQKVRNAFDVHLEDCLSSLFSNQMLVEEIQSTKMPHILPLHCDVIVRMLLELNCVTVITSLHLQQAILISLLTHIRQGNIGSCVGSSRAHELQKDLLQTVRLYKEMLIQGEIRNDYGKFHFLPHLDTQNLNKNVYFLLDGTLINDRIKNIKIWQIPGVQSLCSFLLISKENLPIWIINTLNLNKHNLNYMCDNWNTFYCSYNTLIQIICKTAREENLLLSGDLEILIDKGEICFLSVTDNLLNRCLEGVYIAMDTLPKINIQTAIAYPWVAIKNKTVRVSSQGVFIDRSGVPKALWKSPLIKDAFKKRGIYSLSKQHEIILKQIKYVQSNQTYQKGICSQITLKELFDHLELDVDLEPKFLEQISLSIEPISTTLNNLFNPLNLILFPDLMEESYKNLLHFCLSNSNEELFYLFMEQINREIVSRISVVYDHAKRTKEGVHGGRILVDLKSFIPLSEKGITSEEGFKELYADILICSLNHVCETLPEWNGQLNTLKQLFLPFIQSSILEESILRCFLARIGNLSTMPIEQIENYPQLPWALSVGANSNNSWANISSMLTQKELYSHHYIPRTALQAFQKLVEVGSLSETRFNPSKLTSGRLPKHSISFTFGHPSWNNIWTSDNPWQYVQENILSPGKQLAGSIANVEYYEKVIIEFARLYESKEKEALLNHMKNFPIYKKSYFQLGEHIKELSVFQKGSYFAYDENESKVESILMSCLSHDDKFKLPIVHFGNTNWLDENTLEDVHFCFIYNPFKDALEIWKINRDLSNLSKTNQNQWINEDHWEFYFFS